MGRNCKATARDLAKNLASAPRVVLIASQCGEPHAPVEPVAARLQQVTSESSLGLRYHDWPDVTVEAVGGNLLTEAAAVPLDGVLLTCCLERIGKESLATSFHRQCLP